MITLAKKYTKWIVLTVMASIVLSCQNSHSQKKWSNDMEIITYKGGGMLPESRTITIKDSLGTYIHWQKPNHDTLRFTLSRKELDDLLTEINSDHFRTIISAETGTVAYDKPTTSVIFKWNGQSHNVSVSATEAIKWDAAGFFKLYNYIGALAEKKLRSLLNKSGLKF